MKRKPQRHECKIQGFRLSYLEWGRPQPGRPSLLILHGLLAAAETFDHIVAGLDPTLHVIALDLPGNGHSERSPRLDTTTRGLASVLRDFILALKLDRPVLAGHSHGGLLSLQLATMEPDLLRGLVLMAPAHPFDGYRESMVRFYLRPFGRTAARLFFPRIPKRMYLFFFRQMPGTRDHFDMEALEPYLHSLRKSGTVPYTLRVLESWHTDMAALRESLERSELPHRALVIWGQRDEVVPASSSTALLKHIPHAELLLLPQAGHLPNEEMPAACSAALQTWLDVNFPRED